MADDDTTPETPETPATESTEGGGTATAVAPAPDDGKLKQTIEITDAGPCKKHVKVIVEREQIDERFDEKYTELVRSDQPQVRGFRPGKAPRKLIEKQYHESVAEEIKTQVLMASLEQLADDKLIMPISTPNLDPNAIKIPAEGPFIYEFEVEVPPEFDLPEYKGLKLRRPVHNFTDAEVETEKKRLLEPYGQVVPKEGDPPVVELGDRITADLIVMAEGKELNKIPEIQVKVDKRLALADGMIADFGKKMIGSKPGDEREMDLVLGQEMINPAMRGRTLHVKFAVKDVKTTRQPELTSELLEGVFGVSTVDGLNEFAKTVLERTLERTQRQAALQQVLEKIAAANWELPQEMLRRQASQMFSRRVMEMKNSGMTDDQIAGQRRLLELDVVKSTTAAMKEHFVLQKIADAENIECDDEEIDNEIDRIATRTDESFRKVKARLEKEEEIPEIADIVVKRKVLDLILTNATYDDYEWSSEEDTGGDVATVSAGAVPESENQAEKRPEEKPADAPPAGS